MYRLRKPTLLAASVLALSAAMTLPALATNPETRPGNNTIGCAVDWRAQSDLSQDYTKDWNGDGIITGGEMYSNRGYLYEVTSGLTFPAVHGPGDFLLHHWWNNNTSLGFRLPLATDFEMRDVTVTIHADSANLALGTSVTTMGLTKYTLIDGNPKYTIAAPAPTVSVVDGALVLHWDVLPAGSANIYGFGGTALDGRAMTVTDAATGTEASHYLIGAELTATYVEGDGCASPTPTPTQTPTEAGDTATATSTQTPTDTPTVSPTLSPTDTATQTSDAASPEQSPTATASDAVSTPASTTSSTTGTATSAASGTSTTHRATIDSGDPSTGNPLLFGGGVGLLAAALALGSRLAPARNRRH